MKILHVIPAFYPAIGWGGPTQSTHGLCNALAGTPNLHLRVLTTDTAGPRLSDRIQLAAFPTLFPEGYEVYYCRRVFGASFSTGLMARLWSMIKWADVVHLTAVYSSPTIPTLLLAKLAGKPVVWSPRGALQRWEGTTRPVGKALWDRICNSLCDKRRVFLHVTSEKEKEESGSRIERANYVVIPNGIELQKAGDRNIRRDRTPLRLLYLGRLHPIKGIENLLQAIASVKIPVNLELCGEGESDYRQKLEMFAQERGLAGRVRFNGRVSGDLKEGHFREADVCIVPSHKENFCMVIAESLSRGLPVIASRGTPWSRVEDNRCGLWVDNDPESLASAIERISTMSLGEMGKRGRTWMEQEFSWDHQAQKMLDCYKELHESSAAIENAILAKS